MIFGHEWGDLPMKIFGKSYHEWPQKIVIHGNEGIVLFLTRCLCLEHTFPLKSSIVHFVVVAKEDLF